LSGHYVRYKLLAHDKELAIYSRSSLISFLLLSVLLLSMPFVVRADTITGTVKDPSGGVVPGARIEITGDGISQPIIFTTDESGKLPQWI